MHKGVQWICWRSALLTGSWNFKIQEVNFFRRWGLGKNEKTKDENETVCEVSLEANGEQLPKDK